jgi:hypothetical protein
MTQTPTPLLCPWGHEPKRGAEEERSRLQRLRDAAGEVSQSVLSGLLGAWLSQVAGLGGG